MNAYLFLVGVCLLFVNVAVAIDRKPCCWAAQYQYVYAEFDEYYSVEAQAYVDREQSLQIVYDYINNYELQFSTAKKSNQGNGRYQRRLRDYNTHIQYLVYNASYCERTHLTNKPHLHCADPSAIFVGEGYYGYGNNRMVVDTWTWLEDGDYFNSGNYTVHLDVTRNGCVPISKTYRYHAAGSPSASVLFAAYLNYETGIRDDKVFEIPTECREPNEHDNILVG